MRKKTAIFAFLAAFLLTLTWAFASEDVAKELTSGIVRLHILANSDSEEDQALKLKVRDRILASSAQNPEMLTDSDIISVSQAEILENGYDYTVTIERGYFPFPQKTYQNLTLPAGTYNAVRIIIGEGRGQNWWCMMYPPLCFTGESTGVLEETALDELRRSVSPETFTMICESDTITIKPSFKLVELWQEVKGHFKNE